MTASMPATEAPGGSQPAPRVLRPAVPVADLEKVRTDRLTSSQQRRAAAHRRDLTVLLRDRPDLAGVHAPADLAVDAVRWGV